MSLRWAKWSATAIDDRQRALLVTNSYADAAVVADALMAVLEANGYAAWKASGARRSRMWVFREA